MNAQQELVAYWQFCESRGLQPSIRAAIDHCRRMGVGVDEKAAYRWLGDFAKQNQHPQDRRKIKKSSAEPAQTVRCPAQNERESSADCAVPSSHPAPRARMAKVSLVSNSEDKSSVSGRKRMKQPALDLGALAVPEIDHDRRRYDLPPDLPEIFPDAIDELAATAEVFCRVFCNAKKPETLKKHLPGYTTALGKLRGKGIPVSVAWTAFRDAIIAQQFAPLAGNIAWKAEAFLPNGKTRYESKPQWDDCRPPCRVPADAPPRPKVPNTRAHYDGDGDWILEDIR